MKKVTKIRVTEIRVTEIRVTKIKATEIRISSNHRELHGAIFSLHDVWFVCTGIAAGQTSILYVGNDEFCHYITMGRAVAAVNKAEGLCVSGDTVVGPSAWCFVNAEDYLFEYCEDKKHVKVGLTIILKTAKVEEWKAKRSLVILSSSRDSLLFNCRSALLARKSLLFGNARSVQRELEGNPAKNTPQL